MKLIKCQERDAGCKECILDKKKMDAILQTLKSGGLVVYPTDTLYALGADPFNDKAIESLYETKQRPKCLPVSIAVDSLQMLGQLCTVDERIKKVIQSNLPGPITILISKRKNNKLSRLIIKDGKIGIRIPDHPLALRLISIQGPITVTSANKHNGQNPKELKVAMDELGDAVDIYVDCGPCRIGQPSAVVDLTKEEIKTLRNGPSPKELY